MNSLEHLAQFKVALKQHKVSDAARKTLKETQLVLLLGPTSSGRNTIINKLVKTGKYHVIISDTTRRPRENNGVMEQHGVEYWFRTEEDMLADLRNGQFLEAEIIHGQQVSGISIRELQRANAEQKVAIDEVDILGVHNVIEAKPDTLAILVLPPNYDQWQKRLAKRGHMNAEEQRRRMHTAIRIFEDALAQSFYTFVINDHLITTVEIIDRFVHGETISEQAAAKKLARELLEKTKETYML